MIKTQLTSHENWRFLSLWRFMVPVAPLAVKVCSELLEKIKELQKIRDGVAPCFNDPILRLPNSDPDTSSLQVLGLWLNINVQNGGLQAIKVKLPNLQWGSEIEWWPRTEDCGCNAWRFYTITWCLVHHQNWSQQSGWNVQSIPISLKGKTGKATFYNQLPGKMPKYQQTATLPATMLAFASKAAAQRRADGPKWSHSQQNGCIATWTAWTYSYRSASSLSLCWSEGKIFRKSSCFGHIFLGKPAIRQIFRSAMPLWSWWNSRARLVVGVANHNDLILVNPSNWL